MVLFYNVYDDLRTLEPFFFHAEDGIRDSSVTGVQTCALPIFGFVEGDTLHQFLPPRPPRLHYSVFTCAPVTVKAFAGGGFDYLVALLNATDVPVDELLAANLRNTSACYRDRGEFLNLAGRELAQLLRADYARLTAILRRCLAPQEVG